MINATDLEKALAAADSALEQDEHFARISKSSLLIRAYKMGLYAGLRSVAKEKDASKILVSAITDTMFPRERDDSFPFTKTGKAFQSLEKQITQDTHDRDAILLSFQALANHVDEREREWKFRLERIRMLLQASENAACAEVDKASTEAGRQQRKFIEELEIHSRYIALLETDHKVWKSLMTS